jgi:uncharacterized membrane protein YdjX (TVP38/TMEM64 family)
MPGARVYEDPDPAQPTTMATPFNRTPPSRTADHVVALWRVAPLAIVIAIAAFTVLMGWHRELSLENLVRHRSMIIAFVAERPATAIVAYVMVYVAVVAMSLPPVPLTICGGVVFGALTTGVATTAAATIGATTIFLVTRSAIGPFMARHAGPRVTRLAAGFRKDAFSYLLFLRLVPLFPFWLVNLVAALGGVGLMPFVTATALGIIPATFAYASLGAGLDNAIAAQDRAYQACLATAQQGCSLHFELWQAMTPQLIAALVALLVLALLPLAVKRYKAGGETTVGAGDAEGET